MGAPGERRGGCSRAAVALCVLPSSARCRFRKPLKSPVKLTSVLRNRRMLLVALPAQADPLGWENRAPGSALDWGLPVAVSCLGLLLPPGGTPVPPECMTLPQGGRPGPARGPRPRFCPPGQLPRQGRSPGPSGRCRVFAFPAKPEGGSEKRPQRPVPEGRGKAGGGGLALTCPEGSNLRTLLGPVRGRPGDSCGCAGTPRREALPLQSVRWPHQLSAGSPLPSRWAAGGGPWEAGPGQELRPGPGWP